MSKADKLGAQSRSDVYFFNPEDLVLVTDKSSPLYDERIDMPLPENLVASIMANGVYDPILVRKNGERDDGSYIVEVVDGRQRVRACIEANKRLAKEKKEPVRVPARLRTDDEDGALDCMIASNEIRVGDDMMTRARKLRRYLDMGRTEAEARLAFGVSQSTLKNLMALTECAKPVQKAVAEGQMSLSTARNLATLPKEEQKARVEELAEQGALTPKSRKAAQVSKEAKGPNRGRVNKQPQFRCRAASEVAAKLEEMKSNTALAQAPAIDALRWVLGDDKHLQTTG